MVNKTQVDFRADPKEWGNALYTQLGQLIDEFNQAVETKIRDLEERVKKVENKINKLDREKI